MAPSKIDNGLLHDLDSRQVCHVDEDHRTLETGNDPVSFRKTMVKSALRDRINNTDFDNEDVGVEDAVFVADLGEVYRQHIRWKSKLPRIQPHYAVKCNGDPAVLRLLRNLGAGFDCASQAEIEQILDIGVDPSRIIYAQPCKARSHLKYATKHRVRQMTFDNSDELYKIHKIAPGAELYLRIWTNDSTSLCRLSQKFGASLDSTGDLLCLAKQLGLNVAGIAFHVGSGASDLNAFYQAICDAQRVFDQATELGFNLHTLDCGGGFTGETFDKWAPQLSKFVDEHFPPHIRVIAEPGRFYTSSAFTLACNVIGRRTFKPDLHQATNCMLYVNDGVYGNFSSIMFDHQQPTPNLLQVSEKEVNRQRNHRKHLRPVHYSVWGPTCDGIDCITKDWKIAQDINIGDWLYFEDMGAYTKCSATTFNGFPNDHATKYICTEPAALPFIDSAFLDR